MFIHISCLAHNNVSFVSIFLLGAVFFVALALNKTAKRIIIYAEPSELWNPKGPYFAAATIKYFRFALNIR